MTVGSPLARIQPQCGLSRLGLCPVWSASEAYSPALIYSLWRGPDACQHAHPYVMDPVSVPYRASDAGFICLPTSVTPRQSVPSRSSPVMCKASNVHSTPHSFTASLHLAGEPCNAYGTELTRWSSPATDRLNIQINPTYVDVSNASWYLLPEDVVPSPKASSNVFPAKVISRVAVERSVATSK